ncbi:MAG: hypothetical protein JWP01_161 [Myxococcales bacterium]|nr:hypothetical protein [Myxococcales bacterium]
MAPLRDDRSHSETGGRRPATGNARIPRDGLGSDAWRLCGTIAPTQKQATDNRRPAMPGSLATTSARMRGASARRALPLRNRRPAAGDRRPAMPGSLATTSAWMRGACTGRSLPLRNRRQAGDRQCPDPETASVLMHGAVRDERLLLRAGSWPLGPSPATSPSTCAQRPAMTPTNASPCSRKRPSPEPGPASESSGDAWHAGKREHRGGLDRRHSSHGEPIPRCFVQLFNCHKLRLLTR